MPRRAVPRGRCGPVVWQDACMLLLTHEVGPDGVWGQYEYRMTWPYDWDFVLEATQSLLDSDMEQVQQLQVGVLGREEIDIVHELAPAGRRIHNTSAAKERGFLSISGISRAMGCPMKVVFVNQTAGLRVFAHLPSIPEEARSNPQVFTTYVSSLEIKTYMALARREPQ